MTEQEYMTVVNRARVISALEILGQLLPDNVRDGDEFAKALNILYKYHGDLNVGIPIEQED